jgi:hypothetical protein
MNWSFFFFFLSFLSGSSWTVIVVTDSLKDDERGGQGYTSPSYIILPCDSEL